MNLEAEMRAAADAITLAQCERLGAMGVDCWPDLTARGHIGVLTVSIEGERWNYDEGGKAHIILPVASNGELVDLVAFDPGAPNVWALRTGMGAALGDDRIDTAIADQGWPDAKPLTLHASPIEWLRAYCAGACVIDGFTPTTSTRLRGLTRIVVQDNGFARWLRLELSRRHDIPEIEVTNGVRHAA